jgi:hypothetical protein
MMSAGPYIRELIDSFESDPNSVSTIRNLLSEASGDIILLSEIQSYLAESLQEVSMPAAGADNRPLFSSS